MDLEPEIKIYTNLLISLAITTLMQSEKYNYICASYLMSQMNQQDELVDYLLEIGITN